MDDIKIRLALEGSDQVQAGAQRAAAGLRQLGQAGAQAGQQTQLSGQQLAQVSAQLQDLFVQIQGGQAPLTAIIQQGSQLSAVFGGIGNAARAVASLITPAVAGLGLLAAAVGGAALAYNQGANEGQAFARALILSGNAAGTTVGQLQALAQAQAKVVGTQGDAAEALAALAQTGQVSRIALEGAGEAAVRFVRNGGDLGKVVDKFSDLGKDPLNALTKFNEAENFLTESVYRQVKALTEQGKTAEAAAVAQTAYANVVNERNKQIEANLGSLEKAWRGIKDEARRAWDSMLNIGRPVTIQDQLKDVQAQIVAAQAKIAEAESGQLKAAKPFLDTDRILSAQQRLLASLNERAAALNENLQLENRAALQEAERARSMKALIKADEDAAKAARELNAERERDAAALEKAVGLSGSYQKDLTEIYKLRQQGKLTEEQYVAAVEKLIKAQPIVHDQLQAQAAAQKEAAKALEDLMKADQRRIDQQYKIAEQVADQVQKLRDEEAAIAVSAQQHVSLAAAIELVRVARLEEAAAKATAAQDYAGAAALRAEIENREKLAKLLDDKDVRAASKKSAEEAAREWKRASEEIERTITDGLMRGFEAGKGFAQALRDTVVNLFKTLVLRPVVQATVQPLTNSLTGAANSFLGIGNLGASSALGGGFGGGAFGTAFSGGSILGSDAIDAGWAALMNGSGTLSGNLGQILGGANGALGSIGGLGGALGYGNALYSLSQGKYGAAAGAGIGTFFGGPIGSAIGSAIGGAIDKAFGSNGGKQSGAAYISNGLTGQAVNGGMFGLDRAWGDSIGKYFSQGVQDALKASTTVGAGLLNSFASAFGSAGGYQVGAFFASDSSRASQGNRSVIGPNGQILSSWSGSGLDSDPTKGLQQLTNALAGDVRSALQQINIPGWAKSQLQELAGDASFEQLSTAVQNILATKDAFKTLGDAMPQLKSVTDEAVEGLLKAFSGIDNLKASATAYYANFYSDAERAAQATQLLSAQFTELGLSLPASRDAYRQLVEAQDLNTESGRKAYAALLQLSPSFAALVPVAQQAGTAVDQLAADAAAAAAKMAEAGRRVLAELAAEQGGLQVELLRAQGDITAAAELSRQQALAKLVDGLSEADAAAAAAAYDYNLALRGQIDALVAAKDAAEQAAQAEASRAAAVASQRDGIQSQIDQLLGNTEAIRARELAGLDESNKALMERYFQLLDQKTAEEAAARASEQASQAAAEAARAADQVRNAWKSISDSLIDEVSRIRGLSAAQGAAGRAEAQTQFAIATAQARAGDQEAARLLPNLSRTLLDLVEQTATSRAEVDRAQAQVAASLESTAAALGNAYGFSVATKAGSASPVAPPPVDVQQILSQIQATAPIINASLVQQQTVQSTQQGVDDLVEEIKTLRAELQSLREDTGRTAGAAERTRDLLILVTDNGNAMQVEQA